MNIDFAKLINKKPEETGETKTEETKTEEAKAEASIDNSLFQKYVDAVNEAEAVLAGRAISEIRLDDPYWVLRDKVTVLHSAYKASL
jgi:hypothetical protein